MCASTIFLAHSMICAVFSVDGSSRLFLFTGSSTDMVAELAVVLDGPLLLDDAMKDAPRWSTDPKVATQPKSRCACVWMLEPKNYNTAQITTMRYR